METERGSIVEVGTRGRISGKIKGKQSAPGKNNLSIKPAPVVQKASEVGTTRGGRKVKKTQIPPARRDNAPDPPPEGEGSEGEEMSRIKSSCDV